MIWLPRLSAALLLSVSTIALAADWPQWRGPTRDGAWRETGLASSLPTPQIPVRWRAPISGGYSGPVVAGGRVYVTDRITEPKSQERVLCFDAATGRKLWEHVYDCSYAGISFDTGPRASPTVQGGRVYTLGARGHAFCLDAATGRVIWGRDLYRELDINLQEWAISGAPLLEGGLVILNIGGANGAGVVALDAVTGKERWRALNDRHSYAAPIVINQAGRRVAVVLTGDRIAGLDARTGQKYWDYPIESKPWVIGIATPVYAEGVLFVSTFYQGSIALRLPPDRLAAEKLWHRKGQNELNTDALHALITTPMIEKGHVYGVDAYGHFRCLDLKTGDRVWTSEQPTPIARWSTVHMVKNGDRYWMLNERGELIIARLSPRGYEELSRSKLIEPTQGQLNQRGGVVWAHPAFANGHIFARNDKELVCADLRATR